MRTPANADLDARLAEDVLVSSYSVVAKRHGLSKGSVASRVRAHRLRMGEPTRLPRKGKVIALDEERETAAYRARLAKSFGI